MSIPQVLAHAVFQIPDFVTLAFCDQLIQKAAEIGYHTATLNTDETSRPDIRNNDRVIFDDPALAHLLWRRIQPYFSTPFKGENAVCLNERFRLYRYTPGQFFDWHQDGAYHATETRVSRFTMMIYLNDACEGGGTSFADVFSPHVFKDFTTCKSNL
mgnify:CR=1 FL=1